MKETIDHLIILVNLIGEFLYLRLSSACDAIYLMIMI
jgi:hypothetical protein